MSNQSPQIDPILTRFRATLDEIYGPRLERVMLYGSRARCDAREDSDYDVAVFLRDMPDRIAELYRLADLSTAILDETGAFIHVMALSGRFLQRSSHAADVRDPRRGHRPVKEQTSAYLESRVTFSDAPTR
jgi:predicted nucleotidyltransferase